MSDVRWAVEGNTVALHGEVLTVGAKCADDAGTWICITHGETFAHNFAKDSHLSGLSHEDHILAWGCFEHGPEVP